MKELLTEDVFIELQDFCHTFNIEMICGTSIYLMPLFLTFDEDTIEAIMDILHKSKNRDKITFYIFVKRYENIGVSKPAICIHSQ